MNFSPLTTKFRQIAANADLFSTFAALSEDLVFYVKTTDNECQFEKQASRKYFQ